MTRWPDQGAAPRAAAAAWALGARSGPAVARALGISESAAAQRIQAARRLGLIPPVPPRQPTGIAARRPVPSLVDEIAAVMFVNPRLARRIKAAAGALERAEARRATAAIRLDLAVQRAAGRLGTCERAVGRQDARLQALRRGARATIVTTKGNAT